MKTLMIGAMALLFTGAAIPAHAMSWDSNGDGMVSASEYTAAEDRDSAFAAWDADTNGMLSADEFAAGNWRMFDQDGDNMWNQTETGYWADTATRSGRQVSQ